MDCKLFSLLTLSIPILANSFLTSMDFLGSSDTNNQNFTLNFTFNAVEGESVNLHRNFLSFALDSSLLTKTPKEREILNSPIFRQLVKHLGPRYIRFGGTTSNLLRFDTNDQIRSPSATSKAKLYEGDDNSLSVVSLDRQVSRSTVSTFDDTQPISEGGDLETNDLSQNVFKDLDDPEESSSYTCGCGGNVIAKITRSRGKRSSDSVQANKWLKHRTPEGALKFVNMSAAFYDSLHNFTLSVGWELIFTLGYLYGYRGGTSGDTVPLSGAEDRIDIVEPWDPTNTRDLLEYSRRKAYQVSVWQLVNEPNSFPHKFNVHNLGAGRLATDFAYLKSRLLTRDFPEYSDSLVAGPDVTKIVKAVERNGKKKKNPFTQAAVYLREFLREAQIIKETAGDKVIDRLTWHHYYIDGRIATPADFVDPDVLDGFETELKGLFSVLNEFPSKLYNGVWLSEGGSAYGGGADDLSNRYIAGFMFLDKLGLCARRGVELFVRQSLYQGRYALIESDLSPNPDYWTAILFKRLVGPVAFPVQLDEPTRDIRIYGHCVNPGNDWYKAGAIVFYVLNLKGQAVRLKLGRAQAYGDILHTYLLTPPQNGMYDWEDRLDPLRSKGIALNGQVLKLDDHGNLPALKPAVAKVNPASGDDGSDLLDIILPEYSYGFFVYPKADFVPCRKDEA